MNKAMLTVCKSFVNRCPPATQAEFFRLLPKEEQQQWEQLPISQPLSAKNLEWDLLEHLHFSWIAPYLRTLAENEVRLFLAALSSEQSKGLEKNLGFGNHLPKLSSFAKKALRQLLLKQITHNQELVPFAFLPEHPLNQLLTVEQKILHKVPLFLGLHDLALEMRQIIATATLKKLFSSLPKVAGEYLNALLLYPETLVFKRLFLENWDGSKEDLQKLVIERGLHRLGLALSHTTPSFNWYVTHRLDMHEATILLKYKASTIHEKTETILQSQIGKILEFFKPKEAA